MAKSSSSSLSAYQCRRFHLFSILAILLSLTQCVVSQDSGGDADLTYVGPQLCSRDGATLGYENTTTLFYDILLTTTDMLDGTVPAEDEYNFVLCPQTVFDLGTDLDSTNPDETQKMIGLIPLLDNSNFKCGDDGDVTNQCVFRGGWYHVLFEDDIPLNNITFYGLTFEKSLDASVLAYGQPNNDAAFINCEWKNNIGGSFLVDMFWHLYLQGGILEPNGRKLEALENKDLEPASLMRKRSKGHKARAAKRDLQFDSDYPSMYLGFAGCLFQSNEVQVSVISNDGGFLDVTQCVFETNEAAVVVANVLGARLAMYGGTVFVDNDDLIGPVFLDSSSTLLFHEETAGDNNIGEQNVVQCEGIFTESQGVSCLATPQTCEGTCCVWGDDTCDLVVETIDAPAPSPSVSSSSKGAGTSSAPEGGCDSTCKALAVVLPLLAVGLIVGGVWYWRNKTAAMVETSEAVEDVQETDLQAEDAHNFS